MGKSDARNLLASFCDDIATDNGLGDARVQYDCTDKHAAHITCIDAMVVMNRIGGALSQTSKEGEYDDRGLPMPLATEELRAFIPYDDLPVYDASSSEDTIVSVDDMDCTDTYTDTWFNVTEIPDLDNAPRGGTWNLFYKIISDEIRRSFRREHCKVVVFGFDVKEYVDRVKKITHNKRIAARATAQKGRKEKDELNGDVATRGIPFKFDDIVGHALLPYPWSKALHGGGGRQCSDIIRFLSTSLMKRFRPEPGQCLIIHGHRLHPDDHDASFWEDVPAEYQAEVHTGANDIPVEISSTGIRMAYWFKNKHGEFDHTAFYFTNRLTNHADIRNYYGIENPVGALRVHIRTSDTDTLIGYLAYVERMRKNPDAHPIALIMEKPRTPNMKKDMCIDISRMVQLISLYFHGVLTYPCAYIAYGLYLKQNDYDVDFMPGVGIRTFMFTLRYNASLIKDLLTEVQGRKCMGVDREAVQRFVAACIYENRFAKTLKLQEERREKEKNGLLDAPDPFKCTVDAMRKCQSGRGRKTPEVTVKVIEGKAKRHDYFVALTECLMFDIERQITFKDAAEYGYDSVEYSENFDRVHNQ